ncbi:MAG: hypothetical protein IJX38_03675 [Clostridia bacterium]|nr:hypothetical protein [Clostridia bacterium]
MRYLSVFNSDSDILTAMSDIFLRGGWYDLDCTYSKGVFYEHIPQPKQKSDIQPLFDDVIKADSQTLDFIEDGTLGSIVFDPPFLFRNRKAINNDKMSARFSYFMSYDDLMLMYQRSLDCFQRKLKKSGYLFFKCQDMTDNKFYCTHNDVINYAVAHGFILKDIVIKASRQKLQRDAKQQNCVAKVHSYWLVFKKNGGENTK